MYKCDGFDVDVDYGARTSGITKIGRRVQDGTAYFYIDALVFVPGEGLVEERVLDLDWNDLANDFENNIYYVIDGVLGAETFTYTPDWQQMFGGFYHRRYRRIIDQEPENINPPQFKIDEKTIQDYNSATKWYCCWASTAADEGSPIRTYLIPEDPISVRIRTNGSITYTDLTENKYYYLMPKYLNSFTYTIGNTMGTRIFSAGSPYDTYLYDGNNEQIGKITNQPAPPAGKTEQHTSDPTNYFVKMYRDGTNIKVITYKYWRDFWGWKETSKVSEKTVDSVKFVNEGISGSNYKLYYYQSNNDYNSGNDVYANKDMMTSGVKNSTGYTSTTLNALVDLDRTDKKLLKLIAIPYSFFKVNDNDYVESPDWQISTTLKTVNNNDFYCLGWESNNKQEFATKIAIPYNPMEALFTENLVQPEGTIDGTTAISTDRIKDYESKIYHSEFYIPKFVYDSFNYQYLLENVDNKDWNILPENIVDYKFTNTCNSRFMFKFNLPLKRSTTDYDQLCIVNRNNEMLLYNSSYLDYIRSGYNYDVKNKEANLNKNIATTAVSTIGTAASIGITAALAAGSGSSAGPIGAAIGAVAGLTAGLINLAVSQSQADRAIQQKLDEANRQGVSVQGCDDIDLLTDYTQGNLAKFTVYKCSDRVENTLNDLFYYCGYTDDVQAIPNLNTRKWFNYIQCDAVFNEASNSVYKEYLDDIRARYKEGVTVYHEVSITGGLSYWDWNQQYENWETSVIDAFNE